MADFTGDDEQLGALFDQALSPLRRAGIDPDEARANPASLTAFQKQGPLGFLEPRGPGGAIPNQLPTPVAPEAIGPMAPKPIASNAIRTRITLPPAPIPVRTDAPRPWPDYMRSMRQRQQNATNKITPQQKQAAAINAGGPGNSVSLSSGQMPDVGVPPLPSVRAPRGTLDGDLRAYNQLRNAGPGVDRIKHRWVRDLGKVGDAFGSIVAPGVMPYIPGTTANYESKLGQQWNRVQNDESVAAARAKSLDSMAQARQRQAHGDLYDAQAAADRPFTLSPEQAQSIGQPELAGSRMSPGTFRNAQDASSRLQGDLATHVGGEARTLSAQDAAALGHPEWAGMGMSNDEYQREMAAHGHDVQLGQNAAARNQTAIQTTGMRDATSEANSERAHSRDGDSKSIPAATLDRITASKDAAISKAKSDFDSGISTIDQYLDAWQAAQNEYEDRLAAQLGHPVSHTDIRSNVDAKGNWIGNRQSQAPERRQAQKEANGHTFVTRGGEHVSIGDTVNVGDRIGTVTGFNPHTGKVQVRWSSDEAAAPTPETHVFSPSKWKQAHPSGNVQHAIGRARELGYEVVQ